MEGPAAKLGFLVVGLQPIHHPIPVPVTGIQCAQVIGRERLFSSGVLKSFTRHQLRMASRSNSIVSATGGPSIAGGSDLSQNLPPDEEGQ
ncbi:hypothetical protein [Rhizobium sp. KDH_Rht_773_N]